MSLVKQTSLPYWTLFLSFSLNSPSPSHLCAHILPVVILRKDISLPKDTLGSLTVVHCLRHCSVAFCMGLKREVSWRSLSCRGPKGPMCHKVETSLSSNSCPAWWTWETFPCLEERWLADWLWVRPFAPTFLTGHTSRLVGMSLGIGLMSCPCSKATSQGFSGNMGFVEGAFTIRLNNVYKK